jgi:UDP-glucose 4-epimerase
LNILITGSTGFIGGHILNEALSRGHRVTTYDRIRNDSPGVHTAVQGDIQDQESVASAVAGHDLVVHAAAILGTFELIEHPRLALEVNTGGTLNVLDGCRQHNSRLLFVSKPNVWRNTYSITKEAANQFCEMYSQEFSVPVQVVKLFNVYGPGERVGEGRIAKAIPTLILKALSGEPLTVFGSGEQSNDFVHVADVSRAVMDLCAIDVDGYSEIEIGTGNDYSVNDLCQLIIRITGSSSQIEHLPPRGGEIPDDHVQANLESLKSAIGPVPFLDIETGLKDTIPYYVAMAATARLK